MREISDALLAKLLARRLRRAGVAQLFYRHFGNARHFDTVLVSALVTLPSGEVVKVIASSSDDVGGAFAAFFRNLDMATTAAPTAEKETEQ